MIRWLKQQARRFFRWVFRDEWADIQERTHVAQTWSREAISAVRNYHRQLSALQALDVDLHEGGKVILLTRVEGRDRVKIMSMPADMTLEGYQKFVDGIQAEYGAPLRWMDLPRNLDRQIFQP